MIRRHLPQNHYHGQDAENKVERREGQSRKREGERGGRGSHSGLAPRTRADTVFERKSGSRAEREIERREERGERRERAAAPGRTR